MDDSNSLTSSVMQIDNPQKSIYVKLPTVAPVYSQVDSSTMIGSTINNANSSTTVYNSSASLFDKIDSTMLMYVAGGALVLYLVLSN